MRVPTTREEAQRELERIMGDYYLVAEDGGHHPAIVEYHCRGIWYSKEISQVKNRISESLDDAESLQSVINDPKVAAWYLKTSLDQVSKDAQKADDEDGDVSEAVRRNFTNVAEEIQELGGELDRFYNIGNVHIDLRILHPDQKFLLGWTFDTPKVVLQSLNDKLYYPIRDRFLDHKEKDQFLAQKKLPVPLYYLTHSVPGSSGVELRPTGEPGAGRGATRETAGRFIFKTWIEVVFGVQKSDYHELWLFNLTEAGKEIVLEYTPSDLKSNVHKLFDSLLKIEEGRLDIKQIGLKSGKSWMASRPWKTDNPYLVEHDKAKEEAKAKKEGIKIVWNEQALKTLQERFGVRFMTKKSMNAFVPILKLDAELRVVSGPVLVPYKKDRQKHVVRPEEIARAAIKYAEKGMNTKFMHQKPADLRVVETALLPAPVVIGDKKLPAGTWWVGFKVYDEVIWSKILKGELTGFSIGGTATVKPLSKDEYNKLANELRLQLYGG